MALGTYKRAHLLMSIIFRVQPTTGKNLIDSRTGRTQIHRVGMVKREKTVVKTSKVLAVDRFSIHHNKKTDETRDIDIATSESQCR